MASYTIYSSAADGDIFSGNTSYATARSGSGLYVASTSGLYAYCGQDRSGSNRYIYETFFAFDLSAVSGSASSAVLSLHGTYDGSTTDFTIEVRAKTWTGSGLTTADWVAGADLAALTLLASRSSSGFTASGYNAFTSEAALLTAVDLHGSLEILCCSAEQTNNSDPTTSEYVGFQTSDTSGTSQDPKIDITTVDASGMPIFMHHYKLMAATN